jgi:hypothetical protein
VGLSTWRRRQPAQPPTRGEFAVRPGNVSVPRGAAIRRPTCVAFYPDGAARGVLGSRGRVGTLASGRFWSAPRRADETSATFARDRRRAQTFRYRFRHAGAVSDGSGEPWPRPASRSSR